MHFAAQTYLTAAAAHAALEANGYRPRLKSPYWAKRSRTDDAYGHDTVSLAEVVRHAVAKRHGGGCYFEIRFV